MQTHGHGRFHSLSVILLSIISFSISNHALANASGKARYSGIVPGKICSSCHTGTAPVATVTIAGPTEVAAGSVNSYTITVQGGPAVTAGFNVAANAGTLSANDASTKLLGTEIVHSAPRPMTGGTASFTVSWKASAVAGPATLFASGISTNGDRLEPGDGVGSASLAITVGAGAGPAAPAPAPAPVAVLKAPAVGVAGIPFAFDGSASTATVGSISQYNWDFGDNSAGSGATITHTFAAGGYTVILTVTDSAGATHSASVAIAVSTVTGAPPPIANPGGPYTGEINLPVQFDGSSSTDSAGPIASFSWDFADGTTDVGPQPVHTFITEGTFNVTLTVTNNAGVSATSQIPVLIGPAGLGGSAPPPLLGQTLYDNNCASCHGDGGAGTGPGTDAPAIVGRSYEKIQVAINDVPDMQPLADLFIETDLKQVAGYLLYNTHCVSCHGVSGAGADDPAVAGTTTDALEAALEVVVEMQPLANILSSTDIEEIVEYLNPPTVAANSIAAGAKGEASISSATNGKVTSVKPKANAANGGGSDGMFLLIVGAWGVYARLRRAKFHNR